MLPRTTRFALRLKCLRFVAGQLVVYTFVHRTWWLIPVSIVIALFAFVIAAGQTAAPLIYTLF